LFCGDLVLPQRRSDDTVEEKAHRHDKRWPAPDVHLQLASKLLGLELDILCIKSLIFDLPSDVCWELGDIAWAETRSQTGAWGGGGGEGGPCSVLLKSFLLHLEADSPTSKFSPTCFKTTSSPQVPEIGGSGQNGKMTLPQFVTFCCKARTADRAAAAAARKAAAAVAAAEGAVDEEDVDGVPSS